MKVSIIFSLAALARQAVSDAVPRLQWDPETTKDCIAWHDNGSNGESCEYIRAFFGIPAELFHEWNPSVSLDCKPWNSMTSYCILTSERLINSPPPTATTGTPGSIPGYGPSPTAWADMGCYVQNTAQPVLEKYLSPIGKDATLTVRKCKDRCYRAESKFAGVQEGNQCWCGSHVSGEWTSNQSDCNTPCSGDSTTSCGGKGVIRVFEAEVDQSPATSTSMGTGTSTGPSTGTQTNALSETRLSSGAVRNVAFNLW